MTAAPVVGLVQNVALFALATVLAGIVLRRINAANTRHADVLLGAILGGAALAGMLMPVQVAPGVIFDGRAIPIALAGLFAGPVGAAVAVLPAGLYRLWLGGAGVAPAMVNFALLIALGLLAHLLVVRPGHPVRLLHLAMLGVMLPLATVISLLFLPTLDLAVEVMSSVMLPVSIAYPLGILLLGAMLADEIRRASLVRSLEYQHALQASIMANAPAIMARYRMGPDGFLRFEYVSERVEEFFDVTPRQLLNGERRLADTLHADDRDKVMAQLRDPDETIAGEPMDFRVDLPGRPIRWMRMSATPERDAKGTLWSAIVIDITEEREAKEREYALAQIVRDIDTPVFQLDPRFNITFVNAAAERMYGHPAADLIGKPGSVLRPPERVEHMATFLGRVVKDRVAEAIETDALRKDGTRIPIELHIAPLLGPHGTLAGWSSVVYDLSDHKAQEDRLERLATTDELTGLANRRAFITVAGREIGRAQRYGQPLSIVVADIDHFKRVNDTHGHAAGDVALRVFAEAMNSCLRQDVDRAARLGGEEFAVLLPATDPGGARAVAERMREAVAAATVAHDSAVFTMTASFGIAAWQPGEPGPESMLSRADGALYDAKRAGRNRVMTAGGCESAQPVSRVVG
ncbi:MAG: diguanylate cyclase [Alphaproteobacteria bacterium]